jgi:P4 family phage/plasmid primase-like protien
MDTTDKIIKLVNDYNYQLTPVELGKRFDLEPKKALEILKIGVDNNVFVCILEGEAEVLNIYGVKDLISKEDEKAFREIINKDYKEVEEVIIITPEERKVRELILLSMVARERGEATELMVKHITKDNYIYTTRDDIKAEMWIYSEGIYLPQGRTFIKEKCRRVLGSAHTNQFTNDVISKIEADTFISQDNFFKNNYILEVPVSNGVLNIKTKKLKPHSPKKIFFNKLPIEYDETKKCPNVLNHLSAVLKDNDDVKVILELIGYCLLKESKFEKAFMFSGFGRNGKSKTMELIKRFLGVDNCSSLGLTQINDNSFEIGELFGKMVNLSGDLSYNQLKETGMLKQLIGRDSISAKRKFLRTLFFVNHAKLIFACNELPKVYDISDGFYSKWILLDFPNQFLDKEELSKLEPKDKKNKKLINTNIINEITTPDELSGLLNMALESLSKLLESGEFSYSNRTKEVRDLWIRKSDSFSAFCIDEIIELEGSMIPKKELRIAYNKYCKKHKGDKIRMASDKEIKFTLSQMFGSFEIQPAGDSRVRNWEGIAFKSIESEKTTQKLNIIEESIKS